jgi:endonuclease/exonuclease/phosphatase family metal-dependent hydrolase
VTFNVATWNVENLFRPGSGGTKLTRAGYRRKLDYLADTLVGAHADVVTLQEVGGEGELSDLAKATGDHFAHQAVGVPDPRGIRVGVLSRFPIAETGQWVDFPDGALRQVPDADGGLLNGMGRGALEVVIDVASLSVAHERVRVVTAHLKSKLLTFPGGRRYPRDEDERARGAGFALMRRSAEATAIRVFLNATMTADSEVPVVLTGDMNDGPEAVTTSILAGPEDGDPERPDKGDPVRLYNLADRIPARRRYSRLYNGRRELIDHIFVSRPLLLAGVTADALVDPLVPITASLKARERAVVPDHACVTARISW